MDCITYRNSGELSDIIVVIDGEEFHLHKFPLYVRSNYFKNLSQASTNTTTNDESSVSRVVLNNFPGGKRTFAIIADYCYNKSVQINADNVIAVRCAAEYLEMTNGYGRSGLSTLTDNILFDLTYSYKSKRDYNASLTLLERAAEFASLAEQAVIHTKLIESFVENLNGYVRKSSIYENSLSIYEKSFGINNKASHLNNVTLHRLSLSNDNIDALNHLPLKWMNDLVRISSRYGLNQSLLSFIIQNYVDYNTKINPNYKLEAEETSSAKSKNLVSMAADIINVENKLNSLLNHSKNDDPLASMKAAINLISIANDVRNAGGKQLDEPQTSNLTLIATQIREPEKPKTSSLTQIASEIKVSEPKVGFLTAIATEVRKVDDDDDKPTAFLTQIASEVRGDEEEEPKTANLTHIASEIREPVKAETSSLTKIASEARNPDSEANTLNLINITGDLLKVASKLDEIKDDEQRTSSDPMSSLNLVIGLMNLANNDDEEKVSASNLISIAEQVRSNENKPSNNLINIASDIRGQPSTSNLKNIAGEVRDGDKHSHQKQPDEELASYIRYRNNLRDLLNKNGASDQDKLNVISLLTNTLVDMRIEPNFPISWLLLYTNALHQMNGNAVTMAAFNKWLWASIGDLKNNPQELSKIPPPVMIQLTHDVSKNNLVDKRKLIDLIDHYMSDLDKVNKLDADTYKQLLGIIPKEDRESFDNPTNILISLLKKDYNSIDLTTRKKLFDKIDFSKLNEETLENCKNCDLVPAEHVVQAALALCTKLRRELDEANLKLKALNIRSSRPSRDNSYSSPFKNTYQSTKYTTPTSARNRSTEPPKLTDRRSTPTSPKSTTPTITKTAATTTTHTTTATSSANPLSTVYYSSAYSLVPPTRLYSRPSSVLNSTYKSNFNPPTSNNNLYNHHTSRVHLHHYHTHHHPTCLDYNSGGGGGIELDDHDFYTAAYTNYSKIY